MKNREDWQEVKLGEIAEIVGGFAFKSNHFSKPAISKHLKNIYKTAELEKGSTVSILEKVQKEGNRKITREIEYYNLDVILYRLAIRVDSKQATQFRIWATKTLKQHLLQGYTINKKRIAKNHEKFMQAVADVKSLLPSGGAVKAEDALELINAFAATWFSLDAYDKGSLPKSGASKNMALSLAWVSGYPDSAYHVEPPLKNQAIAVLSGSCASVAM